MSWSIAILTGVIALAPLWVTGICLRQPPGAAQRMVRGLGTLWAIAFCLATIGATTARYAWQTTLALAAATWLLLAAWIARLVTELKNRPPAGPRN